MTAPDVTVDDEGSIVLVTPRSAAAREWLAAYLPDDATWFGGAVVVEPRYVADIVDGMRAAGLRVG